MLNSRFMSMFTHITVHLLTDEQQQNCRIVFVVPLSISMRDPTRQFDYWRVRPVHFLITRGKRLYDFFLNFVVELFNDLIFRKINTIMKNFLLKLMPRDFNKKFFLIISFL